MDAQQLYKLRKDLSGDGVEFCYSGYITEDVLTSIGKVLKSKLLADNVDQRTIRSVFHFLVEQVQNIIRYSAETEAIQEPPGGIQFGLVMIGFRDGHHFVTCANLVSLERVELLRSTLDHIHSLGEAELKALYKQKLRSEAPEHSHGAGVGFIDIARRASHFDYNFSDVDDSFAYFSITAYV